MRFVKFWDMELLLYKIKAIIGRHFLGQSLATAMLVFFLVFLVFQLQESAFLNWR